MKQTSNNKIHERINHKGGRRIHSRIRETANSDIRGNKEKSTRNAIRRNLNAAHGTRLNYEITKPMYKPVRKLLTRVN